MGGLIYGNIKRQRDRYPPQTRSDQSHQLCSKQFQLPSLYQYPAKVTEWHLTQHLLPLIFLKHKRSYIINFNNIGSKILECTQFMANKMTERRLIKTQCRYISILNKGKTEWCRKG